MRFLQVFILLLLFNPVSAQEAKIDLKHVGYGKTMEEAYFTVHNIGKVPITDVKVYLDGNEVKTIRGRTNPGKGFGFVLYLTAGKHEVKVNTSEGAQDSLIVGVAESPKRVRTIRVGEEKRWRDGRSFLEKYKFIVVLFLVGVILLILYFFVKKPRLEK